MPLKPGETTNEIMAWSFRAIVGFATLVGLPLAGFMLNRAVGTLDNVSVQSVLHTTQLNRLEQSVMDHVDFLTRVTADHESRIRQLERPSQR
jgi:hypothetical protein